MRKKRQKNGFWRGLESYLYKRLGGVPFRWEWIGVGIGVAVLAGSFADGYFTIPTLWEKEEKIIEVAAKQGDYRTAQKVYERAMMDGERKILGTKAELEELAYPKRRLAREIAAEEELAKRYPGHRDILLNLVRLYWEAGSEKRAKENFEKARKLDPNGKEVQIAEKLLENEN